MTYFELSSFLAGLFSPLLIAIGYGLGYIINGNKNEKEDK